MKSIALVLLLAAPLAMTQAPAQTSVTKKPFGTLPDGSPADLYLLKDATLTIGITTYGAHIVTVQAPDRAGNKADVILGFSDLAGYLADTKTYMGSVVGRYGNRIALASFNLDGSIYQLSPNNNGNTLHGGKVGFDRHNWSGKQIPNGVELTLISPNLDMGFPGTLTAHVRYTLVGDKLHIDYTATTDKPTVVNLTNHTYFNLAGAGDILAHTLQLDADSFTPVDAKLIPTGVIAPVAGTPFDFRQPTAIGARIDAPDDQLKIAGGYDHNFVLSTHGSLDIPAAVVTDPASGRTLKVYTTEPGVQFYAGVSLDGTAIGRSGQPYKKHAGFCLETQHYPDSPNQDNFPTTTLRPGQTYRTSTIFQFTTQ